jgi:hypothetical protein
MGLPEQDEPFREERGALDLSNLILGYGWEEDQSDDDQLRSW